MSIKENESQEERGILQKKEEWEECDAPRTKSEDSNPSSYIDVRRSYSGQTYLCMSFHKIRTRPLPGNQGQAFQAHSLQIMLFGPITYEPNVILGSLKIVSLQLAPSVGRLARWHRWRWSQASIKQRSVKVPPFPATCGCCSDINFR